MIATATTDEAAGTSPAATLIASTAPSGWVAAPAT